MEDKKQIDKILSDLEKVKKSLPKNENSKSKDNSEKNDKSEKKQKNLSPIEELENDIHDLILTNNDLLNKWKMEQADKINLKRKLDQDLIDVRKYGGERLAKEILQPLDFLRKVSTSETTNEDVKKYLDGIKMLFNQVDAALSNSGVTLIQTKPGDDFDENIHEPIEKVKTEAQASGKIVSVISNGYKLHDRVIMFAKVKIAE